MPDNQPRTHLFEQSLTRRDLGRYAAVAAGLAGIVPGIATSASARAAGLSALQEIPRGGSITIANPNDAVTFDPALDIGTSFHVTANLFDTLVGFTSDLAYEGIMAESWEISEDGLEYTFHLRSGVLFHDGTELNADAVKFTFDRIIDPATNAVSIGWISALKETVVIDPQTVKLVLSAPFAPLLSNLTVASFGIVSPTAVEKYGSEFGLNPVGSGPWKFKEWITGETVTIERYDGWRNFASYLDNPGPAYLDELIFRNIPEADTQLAAIETGEVDVINLPPREVERFQSDENYQVFLAPDGLMQHIEFSMEPQAEGAFGATFKPPFDDLRLRQAVGYAVDADDIIENVLFGLATRAYGPVSVRLFAYKPEIEQFGFHYDPAKAMALLDEAGWTDADGDGVREKDGVKLEIIFSSSSETTAERVSQVLQNQLNQVGFGATLQTFEPASYRQSVDDGDSNLDYAGFSWVDPHILAMAAGIPNWQFSRFHDEQYLSLLDQATKTIDQAERTELYFEASKIVLTNAAMIPLWCPLIPKGVRAEVKGYKFDPPRGLPTYEDIYVED